MERPTSNLFDKPVTEAKLTPEILRRDFDGTVFNGINAVRVEFDENGEVLGINSFRTLDGSVKKPFVRSENGGWCGEEGFYGDSSVLGKRLNAIVTYTKDEWKLWKETEGEHPGVDFRRWKAQQIDAMAKEYERLQSEQS